MIIGGSTTSCEYQNISISSDDALAFTSGICYSTATALTFGIISVFDLVTSTHLTSYDIVDTDFYNICESEEIAGSTYYLTCMYFNSNISAIKIVRLSV
jgi:hypothetical protein